MKRLLYIAITTVTLTACSRNKEIGEYLYFEAGKVPIIHIDKKCGRNTFYVKSKEIYSKRYQGRFCSKCISEQQLKAIEDSIAK